MSWYERDEGDSRTVIVWEGSTQRPTQIVDVHGNPYYVERVIRMGYDLTPKMKKAPQPT